MNKYIALPINLSATIALAVCLLSGSPVVASEAGKAYLAADNQLNQVYQELISKIKSSKDKQRLVVAEQAWIKFRDADVNFYGKYYPASKNGLFLRTKLTEDRTAYLQLLLKNLTQPDGDNLGPI
jgi:uncharacterized protein YecT (DUF1311 family)